jgi:hypothetical protein
LLSARDAVAIDTPAMRATSAMLIFSDGRGTSQLYTSFGSVFKIVWKRFQQTRPVISWQVLGRNGA